VHSGVAVSRVPRSRRIGLSGDLLRGVVADAPPLLRRPTNSDTAVTMRLSALQTEVGKVTDGGPQVSEIGLIKVGFFGVN